MRSASETTTGARIEYRYTVAGRHYKGRRIGLTGEIYCNHSNRADRLLARYHAGATVRVWYDPRDPADACLERTAEGAWFQLLIAAGFAQAAAVRAKL